MHKITTLQEIIEQYVHVPSVTNSSGWRSVLCKVCKDRGHKGPRAGFKFENNVVAYHCFNCGIASVFDPTTHKRIPKKMNIILEAFGVPQDDLNIIKFQLLGTKQAAAWQKKREAIEPEAIELPKNFYKLELNPDDKWSIVAWEYLESRNIDPQSYPFYLSTFDTDETKKWKGRVIIPIYKDGKLIFYQGRDMTDKRKKKYESPGIAKSKILYGYDQLFHNIDAPLYIMEGWFDAFLINGVACFGNNFSKAQLQWLKMSPREKIVIPDKQGNGYMLAEQAIKLGWSVCVPDLGGAKDLSEAVEKYGKLFVLKVVSDGIKRGFEAQVFVETLCKR